MSSIDLNPDTVVSFKLIVLSQFFLYQWAPHLCWVQLCNITWISCNLQTWKPICMWIISFLEMMVRHKLSNTRSGVCLSWWAYDQVLLSQIPKLVGRGLWSVFHGNLAPSESHDIDELWYWATKSECQPLWGCSVPVDSVFQKHTGAYLLWAETWKIPLL